ncbi:MAG: hypothetical protein EOP83_15675 [Verrucomicrobiaceae bacterium]|nr:MAG: hypothetical protein EOP83_15675 [Verrucomicrobiaceae bacterium]
MTDRFEQISKESLTEADRAGMDITSLIRRGIWEDATTFVIVGYRVDRPNRLIDDAAAETMKLAMAWCTERFGSPVGAAKKRERWDYHFGYGRVFVFDPTDAFDFKLRWC